jgi:hypothetical protein
VRPEADFLGHFAQRSIHGAFARVDLALWESGGRPMCDPIALFGDRDLDPGLDSAIDDPPRTDFPALCHGRAGL